MPNKRKFKPLLIGCAGAFFVLVIIPAAFFATMLIWPTAKCPGPETITVNNQELRAIYACNSAEHIKGLGDITAEQFSVKADVMLFAFKEPRIQSFWMEGMQFPLDIIWVDGGEIVKIQENIPHPKEGEDPARMDSAPYKVNTVLELQAGAVEKWGIEVGDEVNWK
jgi:uncharacterized membrane protein (UPF0127 family)